MSASRHGLDWLDAAVVDGSADVPGDPLRSEIFEAVSVVRDGAVARRVLALAADPRTPVRHTAVRLLWQLCSGPWPEAAVLAADRLLDADEEIRRTAAWLLSEEGGPEAAAAVLLDPCHPADSVARVTLAEAAGWRFDRETTVLLRRDRDPAVRLTMALRALSEAPPAEWAEIEAEVRAGLRVWAEGGSPIRHNVGDIWSYAYTSPDVDREEEHYALAAELLAGHQPPLIRKAGIAVVRRAMWAWRAAPRRLAPLLDSLLDSDELRTEAAEILHPRVSEIPVVADALEPVAAPALPDLVAMLYTALEDGTGVGPALSALGDIGPAALPAVPLLRRALAEQPAGSGRAAIALMKVSGERRWGEEALDSLEPGRRLPRATAALLEYLLDNGGLSERHGELLRTLYDQPGITRARTAKLMWRHFGPPVAGRLLETLPELISDDYTGEPALAALGEMGRHARPALPALDALIDRRRRLPFNEPTAEAETHADEKVLAMARRARERILAAP